MRYFKLVKSGIDVGPFLDEIAAHSEQWSIDTSRQENIPKQRETETITLRAHADHARLDTKTRRAIPVGYRGRPSSMSSHFPLASEYVDDLVRGMNGAMGRAVIVSLRPHGTVYPHTDDGLYWLLRDRYHLVLKSVEGSRFKAGGEEVRMREGELWWFDPTVPHEAFNDSDEVRIHIIADVLSRQSIGSFQVRLMRAPVRSLQAVAGAMVRRFAWPIQQQFIRLSPKAGGLARPRRITPNRGACRVDFETLDTFLWLLGLTGAIATSGLLLAGRRSAIRDQAVVRRRQPLFEGPLGAPLFQHLVDTADPDTSAVCANYANFSVALAGSDKALAREVTGMARTIGVYDPAAVEDFRSLLRDERINAALLTVRQALDEMLDLYGDASAGASTLIIAAYFACIDGLRKFGDDFMGWYTETRHVVAMTGCEIQRRAELEASTVASTA